MIWTDRLAGAVGHLLVARCTVHDSLVVALDDAFAAAARDPEEPRLDQVSLLDLDKGPRIGRVRAVLGLGWQARDRLARLAEATGRSVDAAVEVCLCGHHHILGLGRSGIATVRWSPRGADARTWLDVQAADEGTELMLEGRRPAPDEMRGVVTLLLSALEAARRPPSPVPGPARGKA